MKVKSLLTKKDVNSFMRLSGDYNPIHWDQSFSSRSLYGKPIVHGALIIKKLFEILNTIDDSNFKNLETIFIKPLFVNENFYYNIKKSLLNYHIIILNNKNQIIAKCEINLHDQKNIFKRKVKLKNTKIKKTIPEICDESKIKKLIKKELKLQYIYNKKYSSLNNLLFNASRIIGMKIPGLYSIFYSINIENNEKALKANYKVNNFNNKYKIIQSELTYLNYNVQLRSILLNKFIDLDYFSKIKKIIKKNNFSRNKILIIGGSRGIGYLTTQICSLMNFEVTSTYFNNKKYLEKLILKYKLKNVKKIKLDILDLKKFNFKEFDYIFYFASPKILSNEFEYQNYEKYLKKYYIDTLKIIESKVKKNIKIFIPSTVYISNNNQNFITYTKVKNNLEKYCQKRNKSDNNIKYFVYRLPEFNTDQNYSIFKNNNKNNLNLLYKVINDFLNEKKSINN